ncbi:RagB/SusD family nutrient uptake outer membrane protein [Mucilaginibacter aquatilis]|uniref:RagB/SusD family nutrient uptake outer membrane protein n=1 Tax=Mucilaginibacter aquatilis TaxID=1517760 RepID=A0A6I4IDW4_9SPHI|nr:RagB/SusD family nutrient uptake outer membrane protein [Mucilaginibacter aquatilis]MVN92008.1 RagB/SusD family nutrient uptake outer membrane protein [Mucilaginibacter aquatilis]
MKKHSYKFIYKILLASALVSSVSCKKLVDVEPENQVDIVNHYQTVYDANAAVIGIYGQLQGIADRYIVLNELRADLISPTINADQYLRQLHTHTVTPDNPWADPKPFYKIIMNCNDALKNFDVMLAAKKLTQADYNERYADINAVRCFLYLQLGMHWGSVPYVTDPLETVESLKDESKFPKLTFNDLLDKLIASMEPPRSLEGYSATSSTGSSSTSLNTTVDGYPTNLFFVEKRSLLGDLYLWRGRYTDASRMYRYVTETGYRNGGGGNDASFWQYKPNYSRFLVTYTQGGNENTLLDDNTNANSWRSIFGNPTQGTETSSEWIWTIPFDRNFAPVNPFIDLFSNQGGRYLLTASKLALNNWDSQLQSNNFVGDARGKMSVRTINGQPVIAKQLYYYLNNAFIPVNVLQRQGRWLLYRAATLNLHFAEAACRDNQVKVAYALTNVGVRETYNSVFPGTGTVPSDVTNIMQTQAPAPYDMDGRDGAVPYFKGPWYRQIGSRSRANLPRLDPGLYQNNQVANMEDAIINEDAAELAFEGQRWGDLLRVSLRRGSTTYLAQKVRAKLDLEGNSEAANAYNKLSTTNGVYLPFRL